jgi:hypothetical protein
MTVSIGCCLAFFQFFVVYCVWPSNADDVSQAFIYKDGLLMLN